MSSSATDHAANVATGRDGPLLAVRNLTVDFQLKSALIARRQRMLRAVNGVDFEIGTNETLGLVGESGSGKSTIGRAILRLLDPTDGAIEFAGIDILALSKHKFRAYRRSMQMVFQDPYSSLDPSMQVEDIIGQPLDVHERLSKRARRQRISATLEQVGLSPTYLERYPHEFSGGQRQRIAVARAIVLRPRFIVCDEPVSALDVSTQSQIINLLEYLQSELSMSYLFVAHDLAVVKRISQRIAVMYLGDIVETGPSKRIYDQPAHPYTEALLSAILDPFAPRGRERIILAGDIPDPMNPPPGCRFNTRCPYAMDICREEIPEMTAVNGGGSAACHLHTSGPNLGGASVKDLSPTVPAKAAVLDTSS